MNIQEQEEADYNIGNATEQQNAFAWASMNRKPQDPRINQELQNGRFVIVYQSPEYCPYTDACMGSRKFFGSAHDTREDAETALKNDELWHRRDHEIDILILPPPKPTPATASADNDNDNDDNNDIPF